MNYQQIHAELTASAKTGEIRRIVSSFIDHETVLTAKTRKYAEDWLSYSPKDAELQENGELPTHYDMIQAAVNGYCQEFVNTHYSGKLPDNFTALSYLSEYETVEFYDSEAELSASGEIFHALGNYLYSSLAIEAIYNDTWQ